MIHPYDILLEYVDRFRATLSPRMYPEQCIAMFHIGRCGSSVLGRQLERHRKIRWAREIYEPYFKQADASPPYPEPIALKEPLKIIETTSQASARNIFGMEIKPYHLRRIGITTTDFINALSSLGFKKFIVLDRRNKLRKIVSSIKAHQSGVFHLQTGSTPEFEKIHIDPAAIAIDRSTKPLLELIEEYEHDMAAINATLAGQDVLNLTYEDDIRDSPYEAYVNICDFLEIKPLSPKINLTKTTPFALRELISNHSEIKNALAGTPHEWMLEE